MMQNVTKTFVSFLLTLGSANLALSKPNEPDFSYRLVVLQKQEIHDASFKAFWQKFQTAVRNQDAKFLQDIVAQEIRYSFGAEPQTQAAFLKSVENFAVGHKVWQTLAGLTERSFYPEGDGSFCVPDYWCQADAASTLDALDYRFVTAASLRDQPKEDSKVTYTFAESYVRVSHLQRDDKWQLAYTPEGKPGYLEKQTLKSLMGHRAFFKKNKAGAWQMTTFIAGD